MSSVLLSTSSPPRSLIQDSKSNPNRSLVFLSLQRIDPGHTGYASMRSGHSTCRGNTAVQVYKIGTT